MAFRRATYSLWRTFGQWPRSGTANTWMQIGRNGPWKKPRRFSSALGLPMLYGSSPVLASAFDLVVTNFFLCFLLSAFSLKPPNALFQIASRLTQGLGCGWQRETHTEGAPKRYRLFLGENRIIMHLHLVPNSPLHYFDTNTGGRKRNEVDLMERKWVTCCYQVFRSSKLCSQRTAQCLGPSR